MSDICRTIETGILAPSELTRIDAGFCVALGLLFLVGIARLALTRPTSNPLRLALVVGTAFALAICLPAALLRANIASRLVRVAVRADGLCSTTDGVAECAACSKAADAARSTLVARRTGGVAVHATTGALTIAFYAVAITIALRKRSDEPVVAENVTTPRRARGATFVLRTVVQGARPDDSCAVCLAELWESKVCELHCKHLFHAKCLEKWLRKAPRPVCPLCQAVVQLAVSEDGTMVTSSEDGEGAAVE